MSVTSWHWIIIIDINKLLSMWLATGWNNLHVQVLPTNSCELQQ